MPTTLKLTRDEESLWITKPLAEIEAGKLLPWPKVGQLLHIVSASEYWRNTAPAMVSWIKDREVKLKVKESTAWRYLAAARYYNELSKKLARHMEFADILDLDPSISPESLEILRKLERVLSDKDFIATAKNLIQHKTLGREELRQTWQNYRPILQGRTARGINKDADPEFDPKSTTQVKMLEKAKLIDAIHQSKGEWAGSGDGRVYETFMEVVPLHQSSEHDHVIFDMIVVAQEVNTSKIGTHGIILITERYDDHLTSQTEIYSKYCNYLWFAFSGHFPPEFADRIDKNVGILTMLSDRLIPTRPANKNDWYAKTNHELMNALLLKALKVDRKKSKKIKK